MKKTMINKNLLVALMLSGTTLTTFAQQKLSEKEIETTANLIENDWRFGTSHIIWLETPEMLSHYLRTAPERCLDDLTTVVSFAEEWRLQNQRILQVEKQVYSKPGTKKSEQSLRKYFTDTDKAKQRFAKAKEAEQMYQQLITETAPLIKMKENQVFTAPKGELTYFYFRQGGGMVYKPASQSTLRRQKDGTYTVELDTEDFDRLDTVVVTQAQVDTIRQMLIDGEVYKMPKYYDEPFRLLDAPSSSVSVKFSDASFSCDNFPPTQWGGKNIWEVYRYLKALKKE